jgi:maltose phosphorylase
MAKVANRYLKTDPWKIIEEGFNAERSRVSESLFSLANEHLGVRGYFEEGYSGPALIGCYLNGIFEEYLVKEPSHYKGVSNRVCFAVNAVDWLYTRIELGGEQLDLNDAEVSSFRRELDFKTGELRRELVWTTKSGKKLALVFTRLLSMTTKEVALQRIALKPLNFSGPVTLTLGLDFSAPHVMHKKNFWQCEPGVHEAEQAYIVGTTDNIKHKLFAGCRVRADGVALQHHISEDKRVSRRLVLDLVEGQERSVEKLNVIYTTRDPKSTAEETKSRGLMLLKEVEKLDYATLRQQNAAHWGELWNKFDISIEGDEDAQQGIRFCLFQMHQTYRGVLEGANIGAKGLTGEAYNGNAFWDTETYCLPFYLFTQPDAAKALLDYRYKTLPQALARAKELDCEGACFPIATIDGTESCNLWQHASLQFQPTTAVAFAIDHYVKVSQDYEFLFGEGAELLVQISRFLASRGQWSPRRKQFGYYGVMGPDEFQVMVNNNCYTNLMAQRSFNYALETLAAMKTRAPEKRAALFEALGCSEDELAKWHEMAERMFIPYDPETKLFEQHEGFFDLPHIDVDAIPVTDFPLYHNWSYDRIYRNDMIKQPDVLMFMFLYNQSFTLEQKRANYDYYEPRCIHESSLSPSLHSILAMELGRKREALDFFGFATRIDLDDYNRNTNEGIHVTSIAAAWLNVVYGFGGMRSDGEKLVFNAPAIPEHWKSYRFQVLYRGSLIRVSVQPGTARIELVEGEPVRAVIAGTEKQIDKNGLSVATV